MTSVSIQAELVPGAKDQGESPGPQKHAFQHFQQTYGPANEKTTFLSRANSSTDSSYKDEPSEDDDFSSELFESENTSFWDVLASLSMLFLWFQRSTFGAVGLIRSLVLGHCLQFLFRTTVVTLSSSGNNNINSDYMAAETQETVGVQKYFRLMQSLLFGTGASSMNTSNPHKQVNGPWPPPALVALAALTILALVVHPDGLTWIMLRKIRDTLMSLLQSSSTCWAIMIRDFGVLGTVSASASITLVLLLAIAMHKAFLSNCCSSDGDASSTKRRSVAAEKKRRRRKGQTNRGGRIKGGPVSSMPSSPSILCPRLPKVEEVVSDGASDSFSETRRAEDMLSMEPEDDTETADLDNLRSSDDPAPNEEEGASIMTSPSALESVVSEDFSAKGRTPVPSVCTVDTTVMADDISCGSFSVRSVQQQPARQTKSRANKSKPNATRGGKASNKLNAGPKQPKTTPKINANDIPTKPGTDARNSTMPSIKTNAAADNVPGRFDQPKYSIVQDRSDGGKGRVGTIQNGRRGRGKGGRVAKNQKIRPSPHTTPKTAVQSFKPSPNLYPEKPANLLTGSPIPQPKLGHGFNSTSTSPDKRLPPISPYSQSLFSAEIGASGWSLPTLPAVTQPKLNERDVFPSLTPALSYQTNPFVTPYSQMPSEHYSAGRVTPGGFAEASGNSALGLWSSVEPRSTPTKTENYDLSLLTTPTRTVRPPPGLPTPPPGFSGVTLSQPILSTGSEFSTPVSSFTKPQITPAFGSACYPSPPLHLSGVGFDLNLSTASNFTMVKENPFAVDKGSLNEAECKIEAELQELGGQMVGSILDF